MKKLVIIVLLVPSILFGQDYKAEYNKVLSDNDTIKQIEILQKWEKANPDDAELYTSYFNYFFNKSRKEVLLIAAGEPPNGEDYLSLSDSTGNYAGFIGSQINYDESNLKLCFDKIDEGIRRFPDRLDMRFGKIYALGQIKDWKSFTFEINKSVDRSSENHNKWKWTNNENFEEDKDAFLGSIQDYQYQLFNTEDDNLIPYMRDIATNILKYYPNHIESLSNVAVTYLIEKHYNKALEFLLKAEKVNGKDCIVLNNIAYTYRESNNKQKAIEYYKKVFKYGDDDFKASARDEIDKLK